MSLYYRTQMSQKVALLQHHGWETKKLQPLLLRSWDIEDIHVFSKMQESYSSPGIFHCFHPATHHWILSRVKINKYIHSCIFSKHTILHFLKINKYIQSCIFSKQTLTQWLHPHSWIKTDYTHSSSTTNPVIHLILLPAELLALLLPRQMCHRGS